MLGVGELIDTLPRPAPFIVGGGSFYVCVSVLAHDLRAIAQPCAESISNVGEGLEMRPGDG